MVGCLAKGLFLVIGRRGLEIFIGYFSISAIQLNHPLSTRSRPKNGVKERCGETIYAAAFWLPRGYKIS